MARLYLSLVFATCALARISKRFTSGNTATGTVDTGVITDCTYWVNVQNGDTCAAIETYFSITEAEFTGYNPALGSGCNGLTVGHSYCVEENYGLGPATTTTSGPTATATGTVPSPTQSGLISTCDLFYKAVSGDTCQDIVEQYDNFTLSDFYSWNPAVGTTCANLQVNVYYCVGVPGNSTSISTSSPTTTAVPTSSGPTPEQSGIASVCNAYYQVVSGDTCQGIVDHYGTFTLPQFYSWNPSVGSTCANLLAGYYVCVGIPTTTTAPVTTTSAPTTATTSAVSSTTSTGPSPTQSGIISTCNKWAKSNTGGTCSSFSTNNDVASSDLYLWNPVLGVDGANCATNFLANEYYCIGVSGVAADTPRQSGIISTCNKYAESNADGSCAVFPGNHGISSAQFYAWNSFLGYHGENCASEFLGNEYYCTGVTGPLPAPGPVQAGVTDTCTAYAESKPGGTCIIFAGNHGITIDELYAWNPILGVGGANCAANFWANEYYCIAVAG